MLLYITILNYWLYWYKKVNTDMDSMIQRIIFFNLNKTIQQNETEREYKESAHNYFSLFRSKWCNTILTTFLLFIKKVNTDMDSMSTHNYFSLLRSKWCNTILTTYLLFIKKVNHPEKLLLFEHSYTVKLVYLLIVTPQHWWDTVVVWKENIWLNLWSCSLRPWEFEVWL